MVKNHNKLGISDNLLNSVKFIMENSPSLKSSEEKNNEVNLYEGWNPFTKKEPTVVNQINLTHGALLRTPFLDNMYPIHHQHIMDIAHKYGFKVTKQPDKNENVGEVKNMSDGTIVKDYSSSAYELTYKKDPSHTIEIYNGYIPHGWGHKTDMAFSHKHNGKEISSGYGNQKHDSKPEAYIRDTFK